MIDYIKNSSLSESSEKKHNIYLNKWAELTPTKTVLYVVLFPAHSLTLLERYLKQKDAENPMDKKQSYSKTNIHSYVSAIVALFKHAPEYVKDIPQMFVYHRIWLGIVTDNQKDIVDRREQNKPTELQEIRGGSSLTLNDLIKKRDEEGLDIMSKLLLAMYTMIPPVRLDYYATQIVKNGETPETENYIVLGNGYAELVIGKYKTSRKHGKIIHPRLPDELYRIIIQSLTEFPRQYLFETNGKPYSSNVGFSKWSSSVLAKLFGVELNLTMVRHIYISSKDLGKMTVKERKELGRQMGHTIEMQAGYEWKG
jgi:hypothetical protein